MSGFLEFVKTQGVVGLAVVVIALVVCFGVKALGLDKLDSKKEEA